MSYEFYQTRMGDRFFNQQLPDLIRVLGRLADALASGTGSGVSLGATCPPEFFRDLMSGDWDIYQELSTPKSARYRKKQEEARTLANQLQTILGAEHRNLLDRYQAALLAEETEELEHAFLTGYQTAIKLILLGVTPQNTLLQPKEEKP